MTEDKRLWMSNNMKRILQNSGKAKGKCLMPVDKYINEGIMCLSIRRHSEN